MKDERGQFYIVAAIIIVLTLSGLASIATYAVVQPSPRTIETISDEIREESARIIEHGIYEQKNREQLLDRFTKEEFAPYFATKTDAGIVFIYGNKDTGLKGLRYTHEKSGEIKLQAGTSVNWEIAKEYVDEAEINFNPEDTKLNVEILGKSFEFELKEREMFYFLIVEEKDGERYVEQNQ